MVAVVAVAQERIRAAGGHVFWNGGHRVMGVLSMTRAMGDQYLKQYGVICTPEVGGTQWERSVASTPPPLLLFEKARGGRAWLPASTHAAPAVPLAAAQVMRVERTPEDEFLLLASDGLWGSLSNAEAVGVAAACIERAQARGADRPAALRVAAQVRRLTRLVSTTFPSRHAA